jgi:hypothetical protein
MKLTLKDKDFLERLKRLMKSKELSIELRNALFPSKRQE